VYHGLPAVRERGRSANARSDALRSWPDWRGSTRSTG